MSGRGTIVVAGSLARKPGYGGHAWVFVQYLLGFRRLGFDVLFVDWLERSADRLRGAEYLAQTLGSVGLEGSFSLLDPDAREPIAGLSRADVATRTRSAAFLLDVMGYLRDEEILAAAPRRVFLDIDPGFPQFWHALGLHDAFAGYDDHVTIGARIGEPGCAVPDCGLDWIATRPPVVLERWPVRSANGGRFTSVASWRGAYGPIEYGGRTYGLRVHELRKFAQLPRRSGHDFELALDIDPADDADAALLREGGWTLAAPRAVAGDLESYHEFVGTSLAEICVAKNLYVDTQAGWFSDRSACYLASGRPVLAQDTGLEGLYPLGEGLLAFRTLDEAVAGVEEICANHDRHARGARELAAAELDSDRVLGRLLDDLGVG